MRCVRGLELPSDHAVKVWASIVRAPGFGAGFSVWWHECDQRVFGAPLDLPLIPPTHSVAVTIFETLTVHVRQLETDLKRTSRQYASLRRLQNPNVIFRDIKDSPVNGVDYLIRPLQAKIVELRPEDVSIVVESPQAWDCSKPFFAQGVALSVIHAEGDCLWVEDFGDLQVGCTVTQTKCLGGRAALEEAFVSEWQKRWDRHRDVPYERWTVILDFARAHLPRLSLSWPLVGWWSFASACLCPFRYVDLLAWMEFRLWT